MGLLGNAGLAAVATLIVWQGSRLLESTADRLATYYRLPVVIQGAVIAAIGSSFPELSSTVIATLLHGEFELGIATVVGSAIFNILVIPALSGLIGQRLASERELVYKDAQFYMVSVAVLLLAFSFAVIYNPVEGEMLHGTMSRPIALIPLLLYGLYIFIQQQDLLDHHDDLADEDEESERNVNVWWEWGRLGVSLGVIVLGVEWLVRAALGLGDYFGTPPFLWGLTVIAAGTSLPDAFISVRAARQGRGILSVSNVLGSNIFDLLVAVPAGVLIAGSASVNYAVAAPMMAFLTLATIALFASLRSKLELLPWECWLLLALYVVFVGWMVLETTGGVDVMPN